MYTEKLKAFQIQSYDPLLFCQNKKKWNIDVNYSHIK